MFCISMMDSKSVCSSSSLTFEVKILKLAEVYRSMNKKSAYDQFSKAALSLADKSVQYLKIENGVKKYVKTPWVSKIEYIPKIGTVHLKFNSEVGALLHELKGKYTGYQLAKVRNLRSIYGWRIFDFLMSWEKQGYWEIPVCQFVLLLEVPKSVASNFTNLKERVILKGLRDIEKNNGLYIRCEVERRGAKDRGKVEVLKFMLNQKPVPLSPFIIN